MLKGNNSKELYLLLHPLVLFKQGEIESGSLKIDKEFYDELLYIMGLKEDKSNGKKAILPDPDAKGSFYDQISDKIKDKVSTEEVFEKSLDLLINMV